MASFNNTVAPSNDNASLVTYVREHACSTVDPDLLDFFLLTVVDFAGMEFPITGEDAMKWLQYSRLDSFRRLFTKVLVEGVDYQVTLRSEASPQGGRIGSDVHFTVDGFKDLCMAAGTEQGRRVRNYYRTLEKVHARYFVHMHAEAQVQLLTSAEEAKKQLEEARSKHEDEVHKALLVGRKKGMSVTYLAILKHVDNEWFILKIGETDDVLTRERSLNQKYGRARFVHMLDTLDAHGLEQHLLDHSFVEQYKDSTHFNSVETVLVNSEIYEKIKKLMDKEHVGFNSLDVKDELQRRHIIVEEQKLELARERMDKVEIPDSNTRALLASKVAAAYDFAVAHLNEVKDMLKQNPNDRQLFEMYKLANQGYIESCNLLQKAPDPSQIISADDDVHDIDPSAPPEAAELMPTAAGHPVPAVKRRFKNYIQQYDPKSFQLLNVFEGPNHAVDFMGEGSAQPLTNAARANTIYCRYRWLEVPKSEDPNTPRKLVPSDKTTMCKSGLVARLTDDLSTVQEVFESQMAAAAKKGVTNSAISQMISKKTPGHESSRWHWWRDVSPAMQQEYLRRNTLPGKPKRNGKAVVRVDSITKRDIDRYDTVAEVLAKFAIGQESLKAVCDGISVAPLKGYLWRWD